MQYVLNRTECVLLTILISAFLIQYFNVSMSSEIKPRLDVLATLNDADYACVGVTNHSDYNGNNFYQQVDTGYFYSKKTGNNEWSGKIDAIALKRLVEKDYDDASLVERCELIAGRKAESTTEVVLSRNTAKRYGLNIGSTIYFSSLEYTKEYVVSGICSDFYGAYEIDPVANVGLILLHQDEKVVSSTFIQFFKGYENDTYARTYIKSDDVNRLNGSVKDAIKEAYLLSVVFVTLVFLLLNFPIKKYFVRLRNEYCKGIHISIFLLVVTITLLAASFIPIIVTVALSDSLSDVAIGIMCLEFATITLVVFSALTCLFSRRKKR